MNFIHKHIYPGLGKTLLLMGLLLLSTVNLANSDAINSTDIAVHDNHTTQNSIQADSTTTLSTNTSDTFTFTKNDNLYLKNRSLAQKIQSSAQSAYRYLKKHSLIAAGTLATAGVLTWHLLSKNHTQHSDPESQSGIADNSALPAHNSSPKNSSIKKSEALATPVLTADAASSGSAPQQLGFADNTASSSSVKPRQTTTPVMLTTMQSSSQQPSSIAPVTFDLNFFPKEDRSKSTNTRKTKSKQGTNNNRTSTSNTHTNNFTPKHEQQPHTPEQTQTTTSSHNANQAENNQAAFAKAVCTGDLDQIRQALFSTKGSYIKIKAGIDINAPITQLETTALIYAVSTNNTELVKLLLNLGADVNPVADDNERPALHEAVYQGNAEIVQLLVNNNADVNVEVRISNNFRSNNSTPLHQLILAPNISENIKINIANILLNANASLELSHILLTLENKKLYQLAALLIQRSTTTELSKHSWGNSLWYYIAAIDDVETTTSMAFLLIDKQVPMNHKNDSIRITHSPLYKAHVTSEPRNNSPAQNAELLLDALKKTKAAALPSSTPENSSTDTNDEQTINQTKLEFLRVMYSPDLETIKKAILNPDGSLKAGIDINASASCGETALIYAANMGRTEIVKLLLTLNADVNAADDSHRTALHNAAYRENIEIVQLLIDHKANANAVTNEENLTPLGFLLLNNSNYHHTKIAITDILLKAGDAQKKYYYIIKALAKHFYPLAIHLIKQSTTAELSAKNNDGETIWRHITYVTNMATATDIAHLLIDKQIPMNPEQDCIEYSALYKFHVPSAPRNNSQSQNAQLLIDTLKKPKPIITSSTHEEDIHKPMSTEGHWSGECVCC